MNKKIETYNVKNSSLLLRADYDHLMGTLKLYFRSGEIYDFVGVPYDKFAKLQESDSAGKYFHSEIKSKFDHMKITKKKTISESKKVKNLIIDKFGNEDWFLGVTARSRDKKVVVFVKNISHLETVKNTIPKEYDIELELKVLPNGIQEKTILEQTK